MFPFRFYAATGDAIAQLDSLNGETVDVSLNLEGRGAMCVAVDPHDPRRIFAGTFDRGIYRSRDGGDVWGSTGDPWSTPAPSPACSFALRTTVIPGSRLQP